MRPGTALDRTGTAEIRIRCRLAGWAASRPGSTFLGSLPGRLSCSIAFSAALARPDTGQSPRTGSRFRSESQREALHSHRTLIGRRHVRYVERIYYYEGIWCLGVTRVFSKGKSYSHFTAIRSVCV